MKSIPGYKRLGIKEKNFLQTLSFLILAKMYSTDFSKIFKKQFQERIFKRINSSDFHKENIIELADEIDVEMRKLLPDKKYKEQYKRIIFNISDPENTSFYKKVIYKKLKGYIKPRKLAKLKSKGMMSDERKKQIKNQEQDDLNQLIRFSNDCNKEKMKLRIKKTHKGEE